VECKTLLNKAIDHLETASRWYFYYLVLAVIMTTEETSMMITFYLIDVQ